MLSIVDIKRELGKNIYIYPLTVSAIKFNSVDLHASEFAWSISTKKSLVKDGKIVVPPHDTALIYTKEAIYVSNKIAGTYHSKVRLVSQGFGHIGTALDAQYLGLSIIAIHNITEEPKEICVGSEFVTISFFYLHSDDYIDTVSHNNPPGHPSLITGFDTFEEFQTWEENNRWCRTQSELYKKMTESVEYKDCKDSFEKELIRFNRKRKKNRVVKYGLIFLVWLVLNALLISPAYLTTNNFSEMCKSLIENISFPLLLSVMIPNVILDLQKNTDAS